MHRVLDTLGIEYVDARGDEIQGFCPAHEERTGKADGNPSWYINADTGAHICFSCQFKGNIVSLVAKIQGFEEWDDARAWLNEGGDLSAAFERAISKPKEVFEEVIYISEASLSAFVEPPAQALVARGLTAEAARHYGILWDNSRSLWIIPIRDPNTNALLGWQEKGHLSKYFNNYPAGMKKSESLFGYAQYQSGNMIVVESPLDVVRLASIGITGAVATFGALVSEKQVSLVRNADRIIFAMDSDQAGTTSSLKLLEMTQQLGFESWFFNYSHTTMKDVGGMSKAEVLYGIESARHSIRYGLSLTI